MHKLLIIPIIFLLFSQCQKEEDLGDIDIYNLKTEINIDYNSDTISIGDTLWIESEVVAFLVDSATQKNIYFSDAFLNINLLVRAWNIENQTYQPDNYSFKLESYTSYISYTNKTTILGLYYYSNKGKYLMKFGIIFHNPGTYSIDGDYLQFKNYYNNETINLGGGFIKYYDLSYEYKEAYLYSEIISENRNIHLYNNLTNIDKESFQTINEINQSKYFFVKVIK